MDLMGLNQNLTTVAAAQKPVKGDSSQLSNQSSGGFRKSLDQFSESESSAKKSFTTQQSKEAPNQQKNNSENYHSSSVPQNRQPYRKPTQSLKPVEMRPVSDHQQDMADKEIQSKVEGTVSAAATPKGQTVDSLTRRAAIQTFMQKMETKLGIEPSEIVQAFQSLSIQELASPPEQNVEKIISFLNLNPEDQKTANAFFNDMLAQSSANSIAEYLKATDRELSLSVMSRNQIQKQQLQESLVKMNDQFFSQPQPQKSQEKGVAGADSNENSNQALWGLGVGAAGLAAATAGRGTDLTGQAMGQPVVATNAFAQGQNFQSQNQNMIPQGQQFQGAGNSEGLSLNSEWSQAPQAEAMDVASLEKMIVDGKSLAGKSAYGLNSQPMAQQQPSQSQNMDSLLNAMTQEVSTEESGPGLTDLGGQQQQMDQQSSGEMASDLDGMADASEMAELDGMEFQVKSEAGAASTSQNSSSSAATKAPAFMMTNEPTEGEQSANIKQIVTQANLLVKNGGGEMKVAMNPEGMGQVNLKVAVNDGNVSVEMVTESSDAKKLIEKGLGDLKATLASHKLSVDNVKVDFSGEVAKQFDHAHDEAQRQSAQNFMEQFRHQNQSWRQGMFGSQGLRGTDHPNEGGPQNELTQVQSSSKKSSNRRLDLVA